jgi:hypothetical protein
VSPTVRERSDRLLNELTWWIAGISAVIAVFLAVVAGVTIPGSSDASASTGPDTSADDPSYQEQQPPPDSTPPVQPVEPVQPAQTAPQPYFGGGGGHARSGGSH